MSRDPDGPAAVERLKVIEYVGLVHARAALEARALWYVLQEDYVAVGMNPDLDSSSLIATAARAGAVLR